MASYNRVILVGNLTRDIELKYLQSGTAVAEVGVAINERQKQGDAWIETTVFVDVTMWGKTAEAAAQYLAKGSPLLIEGRLKLDTWEKDGQKRSKLRVVCERMQMLGSKEQSQPRSGSPPTKPVDAPPRASGQTATTAVAQHEVGTQGDGDDIPF